MRTPFRSNNGNNFNTGNQGYQGYPNQGCPNQGYANYNGGYADGYPIQGYFGGNMGYPQGPQGNYNAGGFAPHQGYNNGGNSYRPNSNGPRGGARPSNAFTGQPGPFDGQPLLDLAQTVLSNSDDIAYVTSEGNVLPRNEAFRRGEKNGIELLKERHWGADELAMTSALSAPYPAAPLEEARPVEVLFSEEACQLIAKESLDSGELETGGALIGAWERGLDGRLSVRVERATGPGPDASHSVSFFSPDLDHYRRRVAYYRQHGLDYLGEWHKHPGAFDSLSSVDMSTARELMRDEGWPMLLLPIVNVVDGEVRLENNILLSPQLGGETLPHASNLTLAPAPETTPVAVYLDAPTLEDFRASGEDVRLLEGVCNPGESYVFLPIPGLKNALLKLVKAEGGDAAIPGAPNVVTAVVGPEDARCFHAVEGEVLPLESVLIDPSCSIYERNAGLTETAALRDKSVAIVGCGSLGSTLALSLARAGVGAFYLFDMDRLSPVNIARHQAGLKDLGRFKASVLRDLIHGTDPSTDVDACAMDVVDTVEGFEAFRAAAAHSDLLICTTDTDDSRLMVERAAVELGVKSLQAGLTARAAQGVIHLYDPAAEGACWACHHGFSQIESSKRTEGVAYSEAESIRDLTVQPGLAAQINAVAEVAALRAIDALMDRRSLPAATFVYVDELAGPDGQDDGERRLHLTVRHADLEAAPACPICKGGAAPGDAASEPSAPGDDA